MDEKITPAHDEIRHLIDVIHYDDHPKRVESSEFRRNKKELHEKINRGELAACHINNGYCEGQTEIHHFYVEYSAGTEVDWQVVKNDVPIDNPDQMPNLIPLCHKHHMGTATGIHMVSYPAWILQKYLNKKNITLFEATIKHLIEEKHQNAHDPSHEDHAIVNRKATAILHTLSAKNNINKILY